MPSADSADRREDSSDGYPQFDDPTDPDVDDPDGDADGLFQQELFQDTAGDLDPAELAELLINGTIEIVGRLTDASNVTMLARTTLHGVSADCVYKPIRGERPLWDFPDGSLAAREVASALIARSAGWDCVPPTYLREGPLGSGMIQRWINGTDCGTEIDLFEVADLPTGWLPVLQASGRRGEPMVLAHADSPGLKLLATFDLVVNNADRKAPHVLPVPGGPVYGVDHGLTLHRQDKLRTVLWGWAGDGLPDEGIDGLERLSAGLAGDLGELLADLLTNTEVRTLRKRVDRLRNNPVFALPPTDRSPIPWPPL